MHQKLKPLFEELSDNKVNLNFEIYLGENQDKQNFFYW